MKLRKFGNEHPLQDSAVTKLLGSPPSVAGILAKGLATGKANGRRPQDRFLQAMSENNEELCEAVLNGWENNARGCRTNTNSIATDDSWIDEVEKISLKKIEYDDAIKRNERLLIRREIDRATQMGLGRWKPSKEIRQDRNLAYKAQKEVWNRFSGASELSLVSDFHNVLDVAADPVDSGYGIKLTKISCNEGDEWGDDEIFIISVVIDGTGKAEIKTSKIYEMDDGDVVNPNEWLYTMKNPNGYLDCSMELWDSDGGYEGARDTVAATAAALAVMPDVTATKVSAIALAAVSGLLSIGGWLDDDDKYGRVTKGWNSQAALDSRTGPFSGSIINRDTGLWDITSYDFDITATLIKSG